MPTLTLPLHAKGLDHQTEIDSAMFSNRLCSFMGLPKYRLARKTIDCALPVINSVSLKPTYRIFCFYEPRPSFRLELRGLGPAPSLCK